MWYGDYWDDLTLVYDKEFLFLLKEGIEEPMCEAYLRYIGRNGYSLQTNVSIAWVSFRVGFAVAKSQICTSFYLETLYMGRYSPFKRRRTVGKLLFG